MEDKKKEEALKKTKNFSRTILNKKSSTENAATYGLSPKKTILLTNPKLSSTKATDANNSSVKVSQS
jgi:hypothetical protein